MGCSRPADSDTPGKVFAGLACSKGATKVQTILLVGLDLSLLSSRAAVLGRLRCRTITAGITEALAVEQGEPVDLVVLCHTLPEAVSAALTRIVHERSETTRVLQILPYGHAEDDGCEGFADAVCDSRPECLLRAAMQLLRTAPMPPIEISRWKATTYLH